MRAYHLPLIALLPQPRTITPEEAYQHFCFLYVSYIQVFRKLEDCYDQCVHPQKRQDIKLSLEAVRCAMDCVLQQKYYILSFLASFVCLVISF